MGRQHNFGNDCSILTLYHSRYNPTVTPDWYGRGAPDRSCDPLWTAASSKLTRPGFADEASDRDCLGHSGVAAWTSPPGLLLLPLATMMTGQLSRGLATLAGRFASNGMPLRPLATSASGVSGTRKSPRGTRPSPLQPLKFVAAEETVPDHVEEALFSPENVEGMTAVEIARMRVVYGFVKEHADVVEKKLAPVDPAANPLIDERSVRISSQASYARHFL